MDRDVPVSRLETTGQAFTLFVFFLAALNWLGWATGVDELTRVYATWPPMTPWTALWLALLGAAILVQSGHPTPVRVWVGRALALVVGALAVVVLAEYISGGDFGIDRLWFGEAVTTLQSSWPGRPSPQTASSVLLLAGAVTLMRLDVRWTPAARAASLTCSAAIPFVTVAAYLFDAKALVGSTASTGQAMSTALALLFLAAATSLARPDNPPLSTLLARQDRQSLIRLSGVFAGFPLVVAVARRILLALDLSDQAAWTASIAVGTVVVGAITFYLSQREQWVLIAKEVVSRERADAERRYRILAENAADIIVHLRGRKVAWISPSVQTALGGRQHEWTGTDLSLRVHPNDLDTLADAMKRIAVGESVLHRFRVRSVDTGYHWVDGHGKPCVDADGNIDGVIAALRIVDDQVEAERRLERLARFDTLTGLANRAEAIRRLELEMAHLPDHGTHLGILFCDVDRFKQINDTWGHGVGDVVLAVLATRICECVRPEDTVGRTGGDEILVLLPGVQSIDEAAQIAEKIRCRTAEPIEESGHIIHATLSIGTAIAIAGEPVSSLTARADAAMYQVKAGRRNSVIRIEPAE
ncbi:MAG: sensor domain-containing diguanylate cyclase [Mycobacterium sp.]